MKKILVVYAVPREGFKSLEKDFELIYPQGKKSFSKNEILKYLPECEAAISIFTLPFGKEFMVKSPNLQIIANYGVGYNNIDMEFARSRAIRVTNTPTPVTEPTAEQAMALMLAVTRRTAELDRKLRTNEIEWGVMNNFGTSLAGKTLGIIGMGRIGQSVARRAEAFGLKVIYVSRHSLPPVLEAQLLAARIPLHELLERADIVSLHLPLNNQTHHFIGRKELDAMKKTAFIINTARGAVIDEAVLTEFLAQKKIAGAGLDVFEFEPKITEKLKTLDNVVLAPHVGTGTYETRVAIGKEVSDNILAHFRGEIPPNLVK